MIHTPGTQNGPRGQIPAVKDRTTDPTKASATPQTKKRLPPRPRGPLYRRRLQADGNHATKVNHFYNGGQAILIGVSSPFGVGRNLSLSLPTVVVILAQRRGFPSEAEAEQQEQ